jgi:hypothetical protein
MNLSEGKFSTANGFSGREKREASHAKNPVMIEMGRMLLSDANNNAAAAAAIEKNCIAIIRLERSGAPTAIPSPAK